MSLEKRLGQAKGLDGQERPSVSCRNRGQRLGRPLNLDEHGARKKGGRLTLYPLRKRRPKKPKKITLVMILQVSFRQIELALMCFKFCLVSSLLSKARGLLGSMVQAGGNSVSKRVFDWLRHGDRQKPCTLSPANQEPGFTFLKIDPIIAPCSAP